MSFQKITKEKFLKNPTSCLIPTKDECEIIINGITDFIKKYFQDNNFEKAIIGLSGGIDSAFLAYLCVKALGKENVYGVLMPSMFTSKDHIEKALSICKELQIEHNDYLKVKKDFDLISSVLEQIGEVSKDTKTQRLKYGNIQARVRMILLRDIAKSQNSLVIGTTNKTEMMLGYATIAGDGVGGNDLEPIANIYKTTEKKIARYLGIDDGIINQKATAELWTGQTDEDEIGLEYELIDQILLGLDLKVDENDIVNAISNKKVTVENVKQIKDKISKNAYKNQLSEAYDF